MTMVIDLALISDEPFWGYAFPLVRRHRVRHLDLAKGYDDVGLWLDGVHLRRKSAERFWYEAA